MVRIQLIYFQVQDQVKDLKAEVFNVNHFLLKFNRSDYVIKNLNKFLKQF